MTKLTQKQKEALEVQKKQWHDAIHGCFKAREETALSAKDIVILLKDNKTSFHAYLQHEADLNNERFKPEDIHENNDDLIKKVNSAIGELYRASFESSPKVDSNENRMLFKATKKGNIQPYMYIQHNYDNKITPNEYRESVFRYLQDKAYNEPIHSQQIDEDFMKSGLFERHVAMNVIKKKKSNKKVNSGTREANFRKLISRTLGDIYDHGHFSPKYIPNKTLPDSRLFKDNWDGKITYKIIPFEMDEDDHESYRDLTDIGSLLSSLLFRDYYKFFMPTNTYEYFKQELIPQCLDNANRNARDLADSFNIQQRGLSLQANAGLPMDKLNPLYQALIDNVCVEVVYKKFKKSQWVSETLQLVPIGINYREPKLYLIAQEIDKPNAKVKPYIIQNMETCSMLAIAKPASTLKMKDWKQIPDTFGPDIFEGKRIKVVLIANDTGNLQRDLKTFKLEHQKERSLDDHRLEITLDECLITHEFIEWIIARTPNVVVQEPKVLRDYLCVQYQAGVDLYT